MIYRLLITIYTSVNWSLNPWSLHKSVYIKVAAEHRVFIILIFILLFSYFYPHYVYLCSGFISAAL
jgi:hypothetical protein